MTSPKKPYPVGHNQTTRGYTDPRGEETVTLTLTLITLALYMSNRKIRSRRNYCSVVHNCSSIHMSIYTNISNGRLKTQKIQTCNSRSVSYYPFVYQVTLRDEKIPGSHLFTLGHTPGGPQNKVGPGRPKMGLPGPRSQLLQSIEYFEYY